MKRTGDARVFVLLSFLVGLLGCGCSGAEQRKAQRRPQPAAQAPGTNSGPRSPAAGPIRKLLIAYQSNLGGEIEACG